MNCLPFVRQFRCNLFGHATHQQVSRTLCKRSAAGVDLDELDTAILRELQADARRTNRDIAAAVGVSPTTALDRTRGLRQLGVIRGARLDVDLAQLGRPVQALIAVRVRPPSRSNIERFRDWVSGLPETLGGFVGSGAAG